MGGTKADRATKGTGGVKRAAENAGASTWVLREDPPVQTTRSLRLLDPLPQASHPQGAGGTGYF